MNTLPPTKKAAVIKALTEGVSIRSASRLTGVSKTTILKLLVEVGEFCREYQNYAHRSLACKRVEADEIWAFVGAKAKNAKQDGWGDAWTFIAICPETKLIVSWLVGQRTSKHAEVFMRDVESRLSHRVQLTTDSHNMYFSAVENAFGWNGVDYAMLHKIYGQGANTDQRGYSPPICLGTTKRPIMGRPKNSLISTSLVERTNLTVRTHARRFTRLTNGFSKKLENHMHAVALHFFATNYCRAHTTLTKANGGVHTTPAMAAGLTNHVWTIEEVLGMMDDKRTIS